MPVNDPTSFVRQLIARMKGTPDSAAPSFRYAEGRRSRSPIIFRPDVDPLGQILNAQTFNQRRGDMAAGDAMAAERGVPSMNADEAAALNVDPAKLASTDWKQRLRVGGVADPQMDPAAILRQARSEAPEGEGPGTTEAYDALMNMLAGSGRRGGIQVAAPTAESADPNRIHHEEGHMLSAPFLGEFQNMMRQRFGIGPSGASEALAYRYQGNEDPTGFGPMVDRVMPTLRPSSGLQRFQRGMTPPR